MKIHCIFCADINSGKRNVPECTDRQMINDQAYCWATSGGSRCPLLEEIKKEADRVASKVRCKS